MQKNEASECYRFSRQYWSDFRVFPFLDRLPSQGKNTKSAWHYPLVSPSVSHTQTLTYNGGVCDVMAIVVGNGHGDTSSYPEWDSLHFT